MLVCHNGAMSDPMSLRGAVDLGALSAQREAATAATTAPAGVVVDVTEATFQTEIIERSMTVPVIIDLWADWCEPCKTLSPILEKLASEYGGRIVLAKIDVEAEQRIGAAFQVQSIPAVFAVIKGQPLPLFQEALPEQQVKQYLDAVLAEAEKAGVTGSVSAEPVAESEPEPEPIDPDQESAYQAMESAQWDVAVEAFQRLLQKDPADAAAKVGLASAQLYQRAGTTDPVATVAAADADPTDVTNALAAADLQAAGGDFASAFARLIDGVRRTAGDDRAQLRNRLLELFEVVGPEDPQVAQARIALANALF